MTGILEETAEQDIRNIFNVNVHATIEVVKSVLPIMREQRSGYVINVGSVAGFVGAPGWSVYSATKAAVAAFSEVIAQDVKEFGVKVTVAEPSGFRTGFLNKKSLALSTTQIDGYQAVKKTQDQYLSMDGHQAGDPDRVAEEVKAFNIKVTVVAPGFFRTEFLNKGVGLVCENPIPEYHIETLQDWLNDMNGKQAGDPQKLAKALLEITDLESPPLHLLMGQDAYQIVTEKRKSEHEEFEVWKNITFSTNIDEQ